MSTKELIELLKKQDPSGTAQVRIAGEILIGVGIIRQGYENDDVCFIDSENKLHISNKETKVDLLTIDIWEWMYNNIQEYDLYNLEISEFIKQYVHLNTKKLKETIEYLKKEYTDVSEFYKKYNKK